MAQELQALRMQVQALQQKVPSATGGLTSRQQVGSM
jgi:hypothetical protein